MTTRELIAGPELDLLVAEKVFHLAEAQMGHLYYWYTPVTCGYTAASGPPRDKDDRPAAIWRARQPSRQLSGGNGWEEIPHYSTDIGAAFKVVEKFIGVRVCLCIGPNLRGGPWAVQAIPVRGENLFFRASTAPLAICLAAIGIIENTTFCDDLP